jgi:hypothetical protein
MKKREVDHVLRAAGRITGEKQFIIIGSQALHGKYPDLADEIVKSVEVDLLATRNPALVSIHFSMRLTATTRTLWTTRQQRCRKAGRTGS